MICFPNCKINIGLYVTNRRSDGYHDLETIFYPVGLKDVLEIVPAKAESTLTFTGKSIQGNEQNNLVWKAWRLLKAEFPTLLTEVDIYLHKVIPMGAGLGGGSADGAFMLQLINDFGKLNLTKEQLANYALLLGSDCPFFIYNTAQFARGRGEKMEDIALDLADYSIQLICPDVHVSTAQAFQMLQPKAAVFNLKEIAALRVEDWKDAISNDFEVPVFQAHPQLKEIKEELYKQGALYASMSGSGSALYGIFPKGRKAVIEKINSHYLL